jgi:hypothetical protein
MAPPRCLQGAPHQSGLHHSVQRESGQGSVVNHIPRRDRGRKPGPCTPLQHTHRRPSVPSLVTPHRPTHPLNTRRKVRGEALLALPSPARALIGYSIDTIFGLDPGQRRKRNDSTLDSRGDHFAHWLGRIDLAFCTLLGKGPETSNLTLTAYSQWMGEGNTLRGSNIMTNTLASYITAAVALLEHYRMDDPRRLTRSGHARQKAHPLLLRVLDRHKLACVERRTWQPITRDMIYIMMYLDHQASSVGTVGWTTSWPVHCDWVIFGLFTGY